MLQTNGDLHVVAPVYPSPPHCPYSVTVPVKEGEGADVNATEVGVTEVGATEVGATEVGATEVGATELPPHLHCCHHHHQSLLLLLPEHQHHAQCTPLSISKKYLNVI